MTRKQVSIRNPACTRCKLPCNRLEFTHFLMKEVRRTRMDKG